MFGLTGILSTISMSSKKDHVFPPPIIFTHRCSALNPLSMPKRNNYLHFMSIRSKKLRDHSGTETTAGKLKLTSYKDNIVISIFQLFFSNQKQTSHQPSSLLRGRFLQTLSSLEIHNPIEKRGTSSDITATEQRNKGRRIKTVPYLL